MRLSQAAIDAGYRLAALAVTGSTNEDAASAARGNDPGLLWIVADAQRAGRGRHGRQWESPPGNLYASLLLVDPCPAAIAPQLGFVAGLALHEAVERVLGVGAPRLALKWPNDLLLDGAKAGGLLLEGHPTGSGHFAVVIGWGVNVAQAPANVPYPPAALGMLKAGTTRDEIFLALSESFAGIFNAWRDAQRRGGPDPFGAIRRLWLERAAGIGGPVTIRLPAGGREGIFEGLDSSGRLQIRAPTGLETIDAGDVFLPDCSPMKHVAASGPARS